MNDCVFDFLKCFLRCACYKHERGQLTLAFGHTEVQVTTKHKPCNVYVSTCDCNHQVCGAEMSMVGTVIVDDGFVLVADIKSDKCVVEWLAESPDCGHCN